MSSSRQAPHMTVDAFLTWAEAQEGQRYELLNGQAVAMAPERVAHNQVKLRIALRLLQAVEAARLPCQVFTDGMAVVAGPDLVFEPDAMLRCGAALQADAVRVTDPLIVVEVASPSTSRIDAHHKLLNYLAIPTLVHYLVVQATSSRHLHHRRSSEGWTTRILGAGPLPLDPPGITLLLD